MWLQDGQNPKSLYFVFCLSIADNPIACDLIGSACSILKETHTKDKFIKETKTGKNNRLATKIFRLDYFIPYMAWYLWVHEKYPIEVVFLDWNRASRVDFSDLVKIFQIWPCFCVHEEIIILTFWGPAKIRRPLVITKVGAGSEKNLKNWIGRSGQPKMCRMNFWQKINATDLFVNFFWPEPLKTNFCSSKTKS